MSYKVYDEYKNSDVDWIGEMPIHWNSYKLKHVVSEFIAGGTPKSSNDQFWSEDNTGIPWVAIGDMSDNEYINSTAKSITREGLTDKNLRILKKDTLIYSIFASLGKTSILNIDATTNQAILGLITTNKIDTHYLKYYLNALQTTISLFSNENTQENLNSNIVKNMEIVIPSNLKEQKQIANYLDKKTDNIDKTITKNQQLIELLEEKRTALINQVVTKGLNPDVPMKDSGVEWIGEIPEHWEVAFLKRFTNSVSSGKTKNVEKKGKYNLHGSTGIIGTTNSLDYYGIFILIARVGAYAGKTHIAKGKIGITDNTLIVDYTSKINYKFLFYILTIYDFKSLTIGSGQPLITGNDVKNIKI